MPLSSCELGTRATLTIPNTASLRRSYTSCLRTIRIFVFYVRVVAQASTSIQTSQMPANNIVPETLTSGLYLKLDELDLMPTVIRIGPTCRTPLSSRLFSPAGDALDMRPPDKIGRTFGSGDLTCETARCSRTYSRNIECISCTSNRGKCSDFESQALCQGCSTSTERLYYTSLWRLLLMLSYLR
ncbi:hypothetical protein HBH56_121930 [Parastagonospora nodorum]|uniref:Uncharacterized protein n=1 Tax=Phaeosphaeria nodorum (strain SN15 / ATCC MYA-4574 / FGSC 10173) TaxID=321614 RepID=A0A7U2HUQ2_PHANO|nr:hypothetical protein HBH56_121930 [Parastagonospora nodorum]QRC91019.1 hypothetical protein JI435_400880 [Parastagonospora nodorum SN15]KAH3934827.1 hypothetical protein HBH54_047480 [Parastagonospora nodorum]KAH3987196.1 hypothetical protein HBH51_009570 [Parastagonospora nodorum]KAH3987356.1 hypothetical protein HBH52_037850 [Parastagonospora nodorum]